MEQLAELFNINHFLVSQARMDGPMDGGLHERGRWIYRFWTCLFVWVW